MVMKDIKEIEEKEFMSQSLMKREKSISESTSTEVIRNCENEEEKNKSSMISLIII